MACVDGDYNTTDEPSCEPLQEDLLLLISLYVDVTGKPVLQMILLPGLETGPP